MYTSRYDRDMTFTAPSDRGRIARLTHRASHQQSDSTTDSTLDRTKLQMGIFSFIKPSKTAHSAGFRDPFFPSAGAVDNEHPWIQQHHDEPRGIYVCCCGHDNELKFCSGKSPFSELTCGKCAHILCDECHMSDIIALIDQDKWSFWHGLYNVEKHKLFQVCPGCGLSARAESRGARPRWPEKCRGCGALATADWPKYVVNPRPSEPSAKMLDDLKMTRIYQKAAKQGRKLARDVSVEQGGRCEQVSQTREYETAEDALLRRQNNSLLNYHSEAPVLRVANPSPEATNSFSVSQPRISHRPAPAVVATPAVFLTRRNALRGGTPPTPRVDSCSHVFPRAETCATAAEHQRYHQRAYFDPSEGLPPQTARQATTTNDTQPERPVTSDNPLHRFAPTIGDAQRQPVGRSHMVLSTYDEPAPRLASVPPSSRRSRYWARRNGRRCGN